MKVTREMKKDMKVLLDAIDEFQRKYDGIYVTADHVLNDEEILASVTVSSDCNKFKSMLKWSDGKYTEQG